MCCSRFCSFLISFPLIFSPPQPVSRRDGPSDEFALLALDEQESDDKEDAEEEEEEAEEEGEEEEEEEEEEEQEEEEEEEEEQEEEEEGEAPLETGSLVEIVSGGTSTLFGVVRWSGKIDAPSSRRQPVLVGVELVRRPFNPGKPGKTRSRIAYCGALKQ